MCYDEWLKFVYFVILLNYKAASEESVPAASNDTTQQNEAAAPPETTDVPCIPEHNSRPSRLQPEHVPPQQPVAESQAPPPPVRTLLCYLFSCSNIL